MLWVFSIVCVSKEKDHRKITTDSQAALLQMYFVINLNLKTKQPIIRKVPNISLALFLFYLLFFFFSFFYSNLLDFSIYFLHKCSGCTLIR